MGRWGAWKAVAFHFRKGCPCFWKRVSSGNVDLKKNTQLKSCEFKLYSGTLGKMIAGRQLLSSSEEISPKRQRRSQFIYFWLCMQSSIHLGKRLLLVTNNRYLRLMILLLFWLHGKMWESGSTKINSSWDIYIYLWDLFIQTTRCPILFLILNSPQGCWSETCCV